jgi:multidrug efflux pump
MPWPRPKAVRTKMTELERFFPKGMKWAIPYDSSRFVDISIRQVAETLLEAVALVFLVMFLFLQNWRYTIIPTAGGAGGAAGHLRHAAGLGFSINVLTMFGMVLVIGIVVDDAIVVVENVERIMSEEGLPPREATRKAMGQISGAIIGVTVVLISVFVPLAFFSGSVGNIYRQFAAVMGVSIAFSAFMALSLTPALCATLLKPVEAGHHHAKTGFFGWFNRGFSRTAKGYEGVVARILPRAARYLVIYVAIVAGAGGVPALPTSFLPNEDQGNLLVNVQLPAGRHAGAHAGRDAAGRRLHAQAARGAEHGQRAGLQLLGPGPERGAGLRDAEGLGRAHRPGQSAQALAGRAFGG